MVKLVLIFDWDSWMPRRRSSLIKKADPGWHDILCLRPKRLLDDPAAGRMVFAERLAWAQELEVEIGVGSGDFLLAAARNKPDTLFVGLEYAAKFLKLSRDRVAQENLKNVVLMAGDASLFLKFVFPEESVDVFHIYFPDPWPKRAHHKKRAMGERGLVLINRCLKKRGAIYFATDHKGYAQDARRTLDQFDHLGLEQEATITRPGHTYFAPYGAPTHFGSKYAVEGRPIYAKQVRKR